MSHHRTPPEPARTGEEGMALIVVFMVVILAVMLVTQLAYSSKIELRVAKNSRDEDQIYYALRGAVLKAAAILRNESTLDGGTDTDAPTDAWANPLTMSFGEVEVKVEIEDEARRFNLLHLTKLGNKAKEKQFLKKVRESMESLLVEFRGGTVAELSPTVARGIVQRLEEFVNRNVNHQVPPAPTESGNKLVTLDEILLLNDEEISSYLLYDQWDEEGEVVLPGLSRYVTLWSEGKVNINTAEWPVLQCLFSDKNRSEAENLLEYRGEQEEEGIEDARDVGRDEDEEESTAGAVFEAITDITENNVIPADAYAEIEEMIDVNSSVFSAFVTAKKDKIEQTIRVVFMRDGQKLYPLLWENRSDRRIPPEGPYAEDEDEDDDGSFFF